MSSIYLKILLSLYLLLNHIQSQSISCSDQSSNTCASDGFCLLNSNADCICGQIQWNQDIAFIFDSSMSSTEWTETTQFASDLLYYGSPSFSTTRAAILQTANPSITSTITLSFNSESILTTISQTLPNLKQISQTNFYLQLSLQNALDLFVSNSNSNTRKILIIFATKEFSQAPCKINMRSNEIYTYTIAIGNFNKYPLKCVGSSENNYEGLIELNNISELSNILPQMESITCPHKPLVKITEIQLNGANNEQYLEIYNYGYNVDLSQFQLFGIDRTPSPQLPSVKLNQGIFAVIYNTDNQYVTQESIPNCINCQCTESSLTTDYSNIKWCSDAIYIGCCNSNIQNACSNNYAFENILSYCQFDDTLSMVEFTIGLIWTNPITQFRKLISTLEWNNTSDQWPIVGTNYGLELQNIGYNNGFGSSWIMSCDMYGTPGDNYRNNICIFDCTIYGTDLCNLNGGMNINQCNGISCDCKDGFYAYYHTCLPLPIPKTCVAIQQGPTASITTYNIAKWDGDTIYLFFHCDVSPNGCTSDQYSQTVTSLLTYTVFDQGRETSPTMVTLQAIGTDGNAWISSKTICLHTTMSPTTNPTPSPTYFIPIIPFCTITLFSNLKTFTIEWNEINLNINNAPPINTFIGYKYYYNNNEISIESCCNIIISVTNSFILNSDWVSISGHWNNTLTGIQSNDELLSATVCNVITQNPTPLPTNAPSNNPSGRPSINPTNIPTNLVELYVAACSGTALRGVSIINMTWTEANFGSNTAPKTDTIYVIEWIYNNAQIPNGIFEISATLGTQKLVPISDFSNVILLQMYCKWSSHTEQGIKRTCSKFTMSPTIAPTFKPTNPPTPPPLNIPTPSPIPIPTLTPTLSPTYIFNNVTNCNAKYPFETIHNSLLLTWELLYVNENNPNIPPANMIKYIGIIGNDFNSPIIAEHIDQHIDCDINDNCWGFAQKSLKLNTNIDPVIFYAEYINNGQTIYKTNVINCSIETPLPTTSPTTNPTIHPTMTPTAGPVSIFIDNTGCPDERCGCTTNTNSECCSYPCDWNKYPAPIIIVSEKENLNTTFYVKRNIQNYPHQISVQFNISAVTEQLANKYGFYNRMAQIESGDFSKTYINFTNLTGNTTKELNISYTIPTDCYWNDWNNEECEYYIDNAIVAQYPCSKDHASDDMNTCTWCDFHAVAGPRCNDITPHDGKFTIPFTDSDGPFELSILTEGCNWGCDWKGEVFLLELMDCNVIINDSVKVIGDSAEIINNVDDEHIVNCSLIYPSRAYIIVTDQDTTKRQEFIKVPDEKYDDWLWYVLLAGVVVLAAASYVLFVWWRNKKIAEAHIAQTECDMEPVINEEETFLYPDRM